MTFSHYSLPPNSLFFSSTHTHTCGEGLVISVLMGVLLRPSKPPHWAMLAVMVSLAFILSIVWLNIIANEVVGVLTALGLLLNIKTGQSSIAMYNSYVHRPPLGTRVEIKCSHYFLFLINRNFLLLKYLYIISSFQCQCMVNGNKMTSFLLYCCLVKAILSTAKTGCCGCLLCL